jgi:hypothetical protein
MCLCNNKKIKINIKDFLFGFDNTMYDLITPNQPVYVFFYNFWNGFMEKTDSMNYTFFITLLEKVYKCPVHMTRNPDEANVLIDSIFGGQTYLYYKKWNASFLFTGESNYYNVSRVDHYDCVLGFDNTHDRYVKCPLYLLFLHSNSSIYEQLLENDKQISSKNFTVPVQSTSIPPNKASVVITNNSHGTERLRFMDRLEEHMTLFYGGKYKNNIGGVVDGHFNSPEMNEFYQRGKFAITMENADQPYYVTEKLVNGLRSGVVPVYWGTSRVSEFFNPKRFLHLKPGATEEDISEMIERMKSMTDEEYLSMIREPIMTKSIDDIMNEIAESIKKRLTLLTFNVVYVSSSSD